MQKKGQFNKFNMINGRNNIFANQGCCWNKPLVVKAEVVGRGAFMICQILCLEIANPFMFSCTVSGICI